ncbi:TPA: allophanate hydrolase [Acinetobacter baumannii]|nr:allophanate hydrolase [Acinetobacter baumannii]
MLKNLWTIQDWKTAYQNGQIHLKDLIGYVAEIKNDDHAWIEIASNNQIQAQIDVLKDQNIADLPLYGVPFAVKDNIDVAGFHTTAACKEIQYLATQDATVVAKLKKAGAIVVGKTNLDQFATGLVGVRSAYGAVKNSFNPEYISGGSSSGSSVVVANGIVPFSLGTDTAGSGRVPAGHNNIVGLKPTKGWFSTTGLIPACRTIDVISIFALHIDDAWAVASLMQGYDETDEYSRMHPANVPTQFSKRKIAIPAQLEFYGDIESEKAFLVAVERVKKLGYDVESIDFSAFNELAAALYNDAWVTERTVAVERMTTREKAHPVIAQIIAQADKFKAIDALQAEYNRAVLARKINLALQPFDALMVPTAPTIYTIAEVEADPLTKNAHMGAYTNFVNFADLSALALPNVLREDGLPSGVTFIGSHNIRQPKSATSSSVGGHTAERVEHSDMVFVKDLDATSPKLWEACSAGYTFDEVQIDFYRANGDKRIKYLQIKLKHVLVSSVTPTVNEEGVPTEAFGLKYAAVEWTYNQQDINGTAKGAVTKKWSLSNNTASYAA